MKWRFSDVIPHHIDLTWFKFENNFSVLFYTQMTHKTCVKRHHATFSFVTLCRPFVVLTRFILEKHFGKIWVPACPPACLSACPPARPPARPDGCCFGSVKASRPHQIPPFNEIKARISHAGNWPVRRSPNDKAPPRRSDKRASGQEAERE